MRQYGAHEMTVTIQTSFVLTMVSTIHSSKECGMVQSIITIRAKISPKKLALGSKSTLWSPAMTGTVSVLFYILVESAGCLGIRSCPGTACHWYKIYVKHDLLVIHTLVFIVKSWSCLWTRVGQNDFMTLPTSFCAHLRFCALLWFAVWWLFTTFFFWYHKHYHTLNIDKFWCSTRHKCVNQKYIL